MAQIIKKYYDYTSTSNTPQITKAVAEATREYMAGVLYTQDVLTSGVARFVIADMSEESTSPRASAFFNTPNLKYPFTAYNIGELSFAKELRSYYQVSSKLYWHTVQRYTSSLPTKLQIPMITFYSNPDDYEIGYKLLAYNQSQLTRTWKSVTINGKSGIIPITLTFEISKGQYAFEFVEQLRMGNIFDIAHNVTAYYQDILLIGSNQSEVTTMYANLKRWANVNINGSETITTVTNYASPIILSTIPTNGATGVSVNSGIIVNFNVTMSEDDVENALTLTPWIENNTEWNDLSSSLTITPVSNLSSGTVYTLTVDTTAKAFYNDEYLTSGTIVSFTTT